MFVWEGFWVRMVGCYVLKLYFLLSIFIFFQRVYFLGVVQGRGGVNRFKLFLGIDVVVQLMSRILDFIILVYEIGYFGLKEETIFQLAWFWRVIRVGVQMVISLGIIWQIDRERGEIVYFGRLAGLVEFSRIQLYQDFKCGFGVFDLVCVYFFCSFFQEFYWFFVFGLNVSFFS